MASYNIEVQTRAVLENLKAVVQAAAGCDVIAPSDMMDGRVARIRADGEERQHVYDHADGGKEEVLEDLLHQSRHPHEALRTRRSNEGSLVLFTGDGHRLGRLGRPAWSWIGPLVEIGYEPAFFLRKVAIHQGALKAHIVIAHFHEGVETYLMEHYRQCVEVVLA